MNAHAARAYMTIGDVLGRLRGEFPDVTISKIRFLEAEGLIEPERSPAGYRQFTHSDVERLRFILSAQRDRYLPLRVIKEQLRARDQEFRAGRSTLDTLLDECGVDTLLRKSNRLGTCVVVKPRDTGEVRE